jgi:hypothetical protein
MSALGTGRFYHPGNISGTHFCWRLSQLQGPRAAGMIMSMKTSSDNIVNRTRDLPTCSAMPQPTAPLRSPYIYIYIYTLHTIIILHFFACASSKRRRLG